MYEREIYPVSSIHPHELDVTVSDFLEQDETLATKSYMNWAEHCTECVMPGCFSSCSFYSPRPDMKCSRFVEGIQSVKDDQSKRIFRIIFKKWGKLEAQGASSMLPLGIGNLYEISDGLISKSLSKIPFPYQWRRKLQQKLYGVKNKISQRTLRRHVYGADAFVAEIFNPLVAPQNITLTFRNTNNPEANLQKSCNVEQGYNKFVITVRDIIAAVDLNQPYLCSIEPIEQDEKTELYFGLLDFVTWRAHPKTANIPTNERKNTSASVERDAKVKCIIWDLDNTLWDGVLIEDGKDGIRPKEAVIRFIKELDKKGILHSVASKNNPEDALEILKELELTDYFLYPQINWGPKSLSVQNIQQSLNIGMDSILFVDDQVFEREEVTNANPLIRALDIASFERWRTASYFDVPVTDDSQKRRQMYADQIVRENHLQKHDTGNYLEFLKDCNIKVYIEALSETTTKRAFELAQRTNQMNFSGTRYSMSEIQDLIADTSRKVSIISCEDRFGKYGIVGLSVLNVSENQLEDLMFSCRIQSKYVDHAVLIDLLRSTGGQLKISYKPTEKNKKSAQIFKELGFKEIRNNDGKSILQRPPEAVNLTNEVVEIHHA